MMFCCACLAAAAAVAPCKGHSSTCCRHEHCLLWLCHSAQCAAAVALGGRCMCDGLMLVWMHMIVLCSSQTWCVHTCTCAAAAKLILFGCGPCKEGHRLAAAEPKQQLAALSSCCSLDWSDGRRRVRFATAAIVVWAAWEGEGWLGALLLSS